MTIHHFYLVAGCLLWLYLLGCLCIKLILAIRRQRHIGQQKQQIDWFLSPGHSRKYRTSHFYFLRSCLSDDTLFDYIFTRYARMKTEFQPGELETIQQCMQELMKQKIQLLSDDDMVTRSLVIYHCVYSGLSTPVIRQFLLDPQNQAQARAFARANGVRVLFLEESEVIA